MTQLPLTELIDCAEAARAAGQLRSGLAAAEAAWAQVPAGDATLRLRVGMLLLHFRYRTGALLGSLELALAMLPLLRATGAVPQLVDVLRQATLCAAETGRFAQSLACAQEGHRLALELNDLARLSMATNALACFFERSGDPWQAERLMGEAIALARLQPEAHPLFTALNNLGAAMIGKFYMLRDAVPLDEARVALHTALPCVQESVAMARGSVDGFYKMSSHGNLGEVLVHLGRLGDAGGVLEEAMTRATELGAEAQIWRIGCTQGEAQLLGGQAERAWLTLNGVLDASAGADQRATHLRVHHALWRSAQVLGRTGAALHHLQRYMALERERAVRQLQAQSELFVTRMEAEQVRQESQRQHARAEALEADVRRDQLTGLGNRRDLELRLPAVLREARTSGRALSMAMLDLDHFKAVNDRHGHAVGDSVLVALASLLTAESRADDLLIRMGGEEFLLVLPGIPASAAAEVCERLRHRVATHDWSALSPRLAVSASIGLASSPPIDENALLLRADAALYRAKAAGRNQVAIG